MPIEDFESEFNQAASTWAMRNGSSDKAILADYFRTKLRYLGTAPYSKLGQLLLWEQGWAPKVSLAQDNSLALPSMDFVYMDVGCWAGHGEGSWPRHREFGVVYGNLVVLCAYGRGVDNYSRYLDRPLVDSFNEATKSPIADGSITRHPDWHVVKDFLRRMAGEHSIGTLYILGATMVMSPFVPVPARGPTQPIRVFLGDLHAPVMTDPAKAHIVENGQEMLRGRLDLTTADLSLLELIPMGLPAEILAKAGEWALEATDEMKWDRTTSREAIDHWMRLYHAGNSRTADIFQDAGQDLRTFVDALADFHRTTRTLELIQLGDLFDLWLGFQRAFGKPIGDVPAVDNLNPKCGLEFARHWVKQSLYESDQGPHLVHLLTLSQHAGKNKKTGAPLNTYFLYGNHDNYRKHGNSAALEVPVGQEHVGKTIRAFRAPSSFARPGLWAEHGHQPDSSNRDEDPSLGHKLTQAAFIKPGVRSLEGPAGWLASGVTGDDIPRVTSLKHALAKCLLNHLPPEPDVSKSAPSKPRPIERCRGIYVMGHSHEPMLKRVELVPREPKGS